MLSKNLDAETKIQTKINLRSKQGLCDRLKGGMGREAREGGDTGVPMPDSY